MRYAAIQRLSGERRQQYFSKIYTPAVREKMSRIKKEQIQLHGHSWLGKHFSAESKIKMSLSHMGQKPSKESLLKRSESMSRYYQTHKGFWTGKTFTQKHLKHLSESQIGRKHTAADLEKMRLANIGKVVSEKTREIMSIKKIEYYKTHQNPFLGKHHTKAYKALKRAQRLRQVIPSKDTFPEQIMQRSLKVLGVPFKKHIAITGQPDIFIKPNTCVFIDGNYWHKIPRALKIDPRVNRTLRKQGYRVVRIWERDIERDPTSSLRKVILKLEK